MCICSRPQRRKGLELAARRVVASMVAGVVGMAGVVMASVVGGGRVVVVRVLLLGGVGVHQHAVTVVIHRPRRHRI